VSVCGKSVETKDARRPILPTEGQDGYILKAIVTSKVRNWEWVPPEESGLNPTVQHMGLLVLPSWSGSPALPQAVYNHPAITTIQSLTVPKANRIAWYTSSFQLAAGDTGAFTYTGSTRNYRLKWRLQFRILNNPNRLVVFGIRLVGQTTPKGGNAVLINGSVGDRICLSGQVTTTLVSNTQVWLGARPSNGSVAANDLGIESLSLFATEAGNGVNEP
jgi:hypothetical protein